MIYVVQANIGGPVKIGFTAGAVASRISGLQCGCPFPLRLLYQAPGTLADERALHQRFDNLRLHGEWFALTGEIAEWLGALRGSAIYRGGDGVGGTPAPIALAIHGPLPRTHDRVMGALSVDRWSKAADVARVCGMARHPVGQVLLRLRDQYERVLSRKTYSPGGDWPPITEWKLADAGLILAAYEFGIAV